MSADVGALPDPRSAPVPDRARGLGRVLADYAPAVGVFAGAIVAWELIVGALGLRAFILPRPSAIVTALIDNWAGGRFGLLPSWQATTFEAIGGLAIGTVAAVGTAFVTARWVTARNTLIPLGVAAGAIPIIAFAPLMNNWFGALSPLSKMMMAAVLVYFPVMVNVTRGLIAAEPAALELMRSYAASEWTVLRKVRVPTALPFFFTALKLATTLSLVGAIVGEYFGGSSLVLGRIIVQASSALRFDITWAAVLLAALTGIVFYLAVIVLERVFIPWHASIRAQEA
ncbi:MAG: ABC transporter permease [Candidatus Limnocylindrales bacterium]